MALQSDPAVNSWVLVSRQGEQQWLKVLGAANGALQGQLVAQPVAWPNQNGDVVTVQYAEVLSTAPVGASPTQPDAAAGLPPAPDTVGDGT